MTWKDEIKKANKNDLPLLDELENKLMDSRKYIVNLINEGKVNKNTIERQVLEDALRSLDKCMEIISDDIEETVMQPDF